MLFNYRGAGRSQPFEDAIDFIADIATLGKQSSAGGEHFARLEINQTVTIKQLLLITSNPQLDDLFAKLRT